MTRYVPVPAEAAGVFLGTHQVGNRAYDLYYIPCDAHMGPEPTLSARYGNGAGDYMSGLPFGWNPDQQGPLFVARVLAEARGLDCRRAEYHNKLRREGNVLIPIDRETPAGLGSDSPPPKASPPTSDEERAAQQDVAEKPEPFEST